MTSTTSTAGGFAVGDRIRCVDASDGGTILKVGAVYTVCVQEFEAGRSYVGIESPSGQHIYFYADRFVATDTADYED